MTGCEFFTINLHLSTSSSFCANFLDSHSPFIIPVSSFQCAQCWEWNISLWFRVPGCFSAVIVASSVNVMEEKLCWYRLKFHDCWWAGFRKPKTSTVSRKANTANPRTGRKKETKSKSRVRYSEKNAYRSLQIAVSWGTRSSGYFLGNLRVVQKWTRNWKIPSKRDFTVCNFADKRSFKYGAIQTIMWGTKTCCDIYMRNGAGGELGLHRTVRSPANPIDCNGIGIAAPRVQQQGTFLWDTGRCNHLETPTKQRQGSLSGLFWIYSMLLH